MKKILISVFIILLAVFTYFLIFEDVNLAGWNNTNIEDMKNMDKDLDNKINESLRISEIEYPQAVDKINNSIKELKTVKSIYDKKIQYINNDVELGTIHIKHYKIERLWITLENYAKDEQIKLKMDLLNTTSNDVYDLNIELEGSYIGITDFIYDIEKDDTLDFKILNFKLSPIIEEKNEKDKENESKEIKLKANFKIENVGIELN